MMNRRLPAREINARMTSTPSTTPPTRSLPSDPRDAAVLIVDDDPTAVQLLGKMLAGYRNVRFASGGEEALQRAAQTLPDVVLLDAEMPGLDGFGVCRALKADPTLAQAIVIFVTMHSDAAVEARVFQCGAVDFITKPVNAAVLQARVETHLRMRRMALEIERLRQEVERHKLRARRGRTAVC